MNGYPKIIRYNKIPIGIDGVYFKQRVRLKPVGDLYPIHLDFILESCFCFSDLISERPGIYFLYDEDNLLYIGKAINISKRIKDHYIQGRIPFTYYLYDEFDEYELLPTIERELIKKNKPEYNIQHNKRKLCTIPVICISHNYYRVTDEYINSIKMDF